jgi:hypothetical protein
MAAGTKKSVNVTDITASPITVLNKKYRKAVRVIDQVAVAVTNIDDVGDIILFGPIPSNAVISELIVFCDDLDAHATPTLAVDVGLRYSGIGSGQVDAGKASGDVVDVDCIATAATTLQAAVTLGTRIRFEADDIVNISKEAWEVGGLATDPGGLLWLSMTVTTAAATGAAGDIVVVMDLLV